MTDPFQIEIQTSGKKSGSLRPLLYFIKKFPGLYAFVIFLGLIVSILDAIGLGFILTIFTNLFTVDGAGKIPGRVGEFLDHLIQALPTQDKVVGACIAVLVITAVKFVLSIANEAVAAYLSGKVLYDSRNRVLKKFKEFPYAFYVGNRQGNLKHVLLMGTQKVSHCLWILTLSLIELMKVVFMLGFLFVINPQATLLVIVFGMALYLGFTLFFQRIQYRLGADIVNFQMNMTNSADEIVAGIKTIKVFEVFQHWSTKILTVCWTQVEKYVKQRIVMNMPKNLLETGTLIGFFGIILVMKIYSPNTVQSSMPLIGILGMAMVRIWPSLYAMNRTRLDLVGQLPDVELVQKVLTLEIPDVESGDELFKTLRHSVQFQNVSFKYGQGNEILKNLNLTINKNEIVALVGKSGGGKTTIVNILMGLFQPTSGALLIDHLPMGEWNVASFREKIGFVPQDPFLFHGTVAENIAFGRNYSEEEIREAAKTSICHDFIVELPQGYATLVGDRGMRLSGGQIQRIAIARAIVRKPEILIFDEATSSLDSISERYVQEAIFRSAKNRTVLIVAHRLSTIEKADKIFVIQDGQCAEEGSHQQLIAHRGIYHELVGRSLLA